MNVLILNQQQNDLQNLDIDIIKSLNGTFDATEIVTMFQNFFFNKMIIDVTALRDYDVPLTYKTIADKINPDKIIFYFKEGSNLCTSGFLSRLINVGIYNFTTNVEGVKYLITKSNTLKDVENIKQMAETEMKKNNISPEEAISPSIDVGNVSKIENEQIIVGFQNITLNAGSTSLIYMLKKELTYLYKDKVIALEIDKTDFLSFGDKNMISTTSNEVKELISRLSSKDIILIDLNDCKVQNLCTTIIYLIEPSVIKLNNLMRRNKVIISTLKDKKVILNKSLLTQKEVSEFEYESNLNILYNMPPLNDRKRNEVILDFAKKIRLLNDGHPTNNGNRIFGLFRK